MADRLDWKLTPARANFLPNSLPQWQPFPDTNSALTRLASKFRLGLLSNIDNDLIAETCRYFPVKFDLIITAEEVRSYKPAPGHFRAGLARTPKNRWLHAAQSYYHDVTAARALDIPVVWVNRKDEAIEPGNVEPDDEVRDLAGLAELLGV
jgi:HAD superfamily hydrolase (TIGR01493 family)